MFSSSLVVFFPLLDMNTSFSLSVFLFTLKDLMFSSTPYFFSLSFTLFSLSMMLFCLSMRVFSFSLKLLYFPMTVFYFSLICLSFSKIGIYFSLLKLSFSMVCFSCNFLVSFSFLTSLFVWNINWSLDFTVCLWALTVFSKVLIVFSDLFVSSETCLVTLVLWRYTHFFFFRNLHLSLFLQEIWCLLGHSWFAHFISSHGSSGR